MTDFQKKTINEIKKCAGDLGLEFVLLPEVNINFVTGKLSDFQIWIDSDTGADFISTYYDNRFEIYDYDSEDQLIEDLIACLKDGIVNREKYLKSPQKDSPPLFNRLWNFIKGK